MKQPAQNRVVASARLIREMEDLAEIVRRHPELHHDSADRLLALVRRMREAARPTTRVKPTAKPRAQTRTRTQARMRAKRAKRKGV